MNVIDLLIRDHETVADLFEAYRSVDRADARRRREIVEQIHDELEDHAGVEEQLVYPALEEREAEDRQSTEDVREAHEEHRLMRELLAELAEMAPDDQAYDAKVKTLKDIVEHHVHEEEGRTLPRARQLLGTERLEEMGAQVEAERAELRTERMAVASPDAVVPPPDDGPPSDWVRSGDVMAVASPEPGIVSPDDPIAAEGPHRSSEPAGIEGPPERRRVERRRKPRLPPRNSD